MFEEAALYEATRRGFDGVICGHIHFPEIRNVKQKNRDILYCNTGDWVENCSALVEQGDGKIELLYWKNIAEQLPISPTNRNRSILEKINKAA